MRRSRDHQQCDQPSSEGSHLSSPDLPLCFREVLLFLSPSFAKFRLHMAPPSLAEKSRLREPCISEGSTASNAVDRRFDFECVTTVTLHRSGRPRCEALSRQLQRS